MPKDTFSITIESREYRLLRRALRRVKFDSVEEEAAANALYDKMMLDPGKDQLVIMTETSLANRKDTK